MIYNTPDEVPDDVKAELVDGLILAGQKLREWRDYGGFHELRAQVFSADGLVSIVCHHDDRVTLAEAGGATDITVLIDRAG